MEAFSEMKKYYRDERKREIQQKKKGVYKVTESKNCRVQTAD